MCDCCGKFVVLLKLPEHLQKPDRPKRVLCYFKGWDGNPYFVGDSALSTNARRHPRKQFARRMFPKKDEPPKDPFFSLD